jgi:REP element-mobilizing transposase RayT
LEKNLAGEKPILRTMKLEVLEKDSFYHIYNRGINGCLIFENDENKAFFLKQLSKYLFGKISIFGYCLMDNHFHLVIRLNDEEQIVTQAFSNFFNSYVKAFNKEIDRTGSLFEKHFKRIKLIDEEYLKQLIVYVHLNPKHHLDLKFETYKFSSYPSFLSQKDTKLEREEVLNLFGGIENFIFCHNKKNDDLTEKHTFE